MDSRISSLSLGVGVVTSSSSCFSSAETLTELLLYHVTNERSTPTKHSKDLNLIAPSVFVNPLLCCLSLVCTVAVVRGGGMTTEFECNP